MTEFEKYLEEEYYPYIKKIKEYLNKKKNIMNDEEKFHFFLDIQRDAPYFQGNRDNLTKKEENYACFLLDIDDLAEEIEPFEDCTEADEKLLELMKEYGYM